MKYKPIQLSLQVGSSTKGNKQPVTRYNCGKTGHIERKCRQTNSNRGYQNRRGHDTRRRGKFQNHPEIQQGYRQSYRGARGNSRSGTDCETRSGNCFNVVIKEAESNNNNVLDKDEVIWLLDSGCTDYIVNKDL